MNVQGQTDELTLPDPPRRRSRHPGFAQGWRNWLLSGTARAAVATGFLLTPTVRVQLGGAAIAALCVFISLILATILAGHLYFARGSARRDVAADIVAVVAVVPSAIVTAGIQSAEDRFGGRTTNLLAALATTTLIFAIVALVARLDERLDFGEATVGALGGALTVAAMIGSPDRYSTSDAWQGLTIAWMIAAVATVVFGVLPVVARTPFPLIVYAIVAAGFAIIPVERSAASPDSGIESLSVLTLIVAGAIMVLIAPARGKS